MHCTLFSFAIALTLAGVRAQLPPQVTPCIENCFVEAAAQDLDGCSVTDVQCLCANKKIQQDAISCLQQQCTTQELEEVQVFIAVECAPPASSSTSSRHSASPSTSSATHSASSSAARTSEETSASSITTVPSTHLSSTTSASVTSLANSTTGLIATSSTAPVALSLSSSPSSASSTTTSSTTPSASPASTNAAARAGQGVIGVGFGVLGALFGGAMVW